MIDCSMYTIDYNEVNNDIIQVDNIIEGNLIQWKKYFMNFVINNCMRAMKFWACHIHPPTSMKVQYSIVLDCT